MKKLIISLIVVMATFASSFAYTHGGISARLYAIDYSNTYGVSTETYYLGSSPTIVYYTLRTNTWGSTASVKNYNTTIDYIVGIDDGVVTQKTSYVALSGSITVNVMLYWDKRSGDYVSSVATW